MQIFLQPLAPGDRRFKYVVGIEADTLQLGMGRH